MIAVSEEFIGTPLPSRQAALEELLWHYRSARTPRIRTMRQWATEEIVIPEGKREGQTLRIDTQPFQGLLLDEMDSGRWHRYAVTGCVQSGKSLIAFCTPILYHLFERCQSVAAGFPTGENKIDKWREELLPVIQRTRYRELLPDTGAGSRGGDFDTITFRHGVTLKCLTGGGGDEKRSSWTTSVLVITEADKLDESSETSREADKVTQMEARTLSHDWGEAFVAMECTVSTEEGRIWQEYLKGSASRIFVRCPYCGNWVHPTRDCLQGWQDAADELDAFDKSFWLCPADGCGAVWTESDRTAMNRAAKLVHRGQEIDRDGVIHGELPRTKTCGFRWDAFNNLFWSTGMIGAREWKAASDLADPDNAEREMRQFFWTLPALPPGVDENPLTQTGLQERIAANRPRGVAPAWSDLITVGVDLGKYLAHWSAVAWKLDGTCHVVDYGRFEIPTDQLGVENAIYNALLQFADTIRAGWHVEGGQVMPPRQVWIDARYYGKVVYQFLAKQPGQAGQPGSTVFRASLGYGASEEKFKTYRPPKKLNQNVRFVGDGYHLAWLDDVRQVVAETNGDEWKTFLHARLTTPLDAPGCCTIFAAMPREHLSFFKHLTAEKKTTIYVPDVGHVTKWIRQQRQNHWLDATYMACPAAHYAGVRIVGGGKSPAPRGRTWFGNLKRRV